MDFSSLLPKTEADFRNWLRVEIARMASLGFSSYEYLNAEFNLLRGYPTYLLRLNAETAAANEDKYEFNEQAYKK